MKEMREHFVGVEDPRHSGYIKHQLADVLVMILSGVLCGMDTLEALHVFITNHESFWRERLGVQGIPSRATLGRILSLIDGKAVGEIMAGLLRERLGTAGAVVAVDGKVIRSTIEEGRPYTGLQILTAYVTESGVILGQEVIHEKTNEIPIFQQMLEYLDIKGKTITADAMHCQRETCRKVVEKNGDYVLGVKKNQTSLYEDIVLYCEDPESQKEMESYRTIEKNGGRMETRICRKITDASWLQARHSWPGLQSVFSIERVVRTKGTVNRETRFYISSLDVAPAKLMRMVREHWKIESLHWMLDVTFSEDHCRFLSENAHQTLNAMRKYALAIHKHFLNATGKKSSIKSNMLACLMNPARFSQLLEIL